MGKFKKEPKKPAKQAKLLSEIFQHYHQIGKVGQLRPEGFLEISRVFGPAASIDMNRLVCQHQQNVASAYMRRIRRDKVRQQDVHFQKLQDIPLKIRRMAVGPNYVDPYSDFKSRLPKLGQDQFPKKLDPLCPIMPPADMASPYVPHNSLAPHTNVLLNIKPGKESFSTAPLGKMANSPRNVEDDLPFPLSPRKIRFPPKLGGGYELPAIRKRLAVDTSRPDPVGIRGGVDISPRYQPNSNSPRNAAFWSFTVPQELNTGEKRCHVASIPRGKDAMAAISSVQKHNKPGTSSMQVLPPIPSIATKA
ncbi:hypothetical protein PoB_004215400 [Plakobranchus ocellatus]|uniref:Uncharacterized protein n=1 Tax=Plakobranchus ocellatus TaxID=259542 RepID=A0AAV4B6C1_9GAST|nr:hypothetical protein PoB_004215400 [Plakobranchus ocellatus]